MSTDFLPLHYPSLVTLSSGYWSMHSGAPSDFNVRLRRAPYIVSSPLCDLSAQGHAATLNIVRAQIKSLYVRGDCIYSPIMIHTGGSPQSFIIITACATSSLPRTSLLNGAFMDIFMCYSKYTHTHIHAHTIRGQRASTEYCVVIVFCFTNLCSSSLGLRLAHVVHHNRSYHQTLYIVYCTLSITV